MGEYTGAVLITLAVIVVLIVLIGVGWRNRLRRQSDVSAPPEIPLDAHGEPALGATIGEPSEGLYVCTTTAEDWLDRIATHALGIRTNAQLFIHDAGVLLVRRGAPDLFIPRSLLSGASRSAGMAGKFVEKDGLLILHWMLGSQAVDTGFRPRYHQELPDLLTRIVALSTGHNETSSPAEKKENQ